MASPTIPTDDLIAYWQTFLGSPATAPLAQMYLNILSAPGMCLLYVDYVYILIQCMTASSIDLECGFSRGGLTVSKLRHSLSDQSVRASTILRSWIRSGIPEIVQEAELLEHIRKKTKQTNKGKGKEKVVEVGSDSDSDEVQLVE